VRPVGPVGPVGADAMYPNAILLISFPTEYMLNAAYNDAVPAIKLLKYT
jgi:hypothetical protein